MTRRTTYERMKQNNLHFVNWDVAHAQYNDLHAVINLKLHCTRVDILCIVLFQMEMVYMLKGKLNVIFILSVNTQIVNKSK